jgi:hypothetical protein
MCATDRSASRNIEGVIHFSANFPKSDTT